MLRITLNLAPPVEFSSYIDINLYLTNSSFFLQLNKALVTDTCVFILCTQGENLKIDPLIDPLIQCLVTPFVEEVCSGMYARVGS